MRIGIITDVHENTEMLRQALETGESRHCTEFACLGDITGFDRRFYDFSKSRSAAECIKILKDKFRIITAGNHDLFAAGRFPDWSDGFSYPSDWFDLTAEKRKAVSEGKVWCYEFDDESDNGPEETDFLRKIPELEIIDAGNKIMFSHYIYPDLTGSTTFYADRKKQLEKHWEFMEKQDVTVSFTGHTHSNMAGFAYMRNSFFSEAFSPLPDSTFKIGTERVIVALPPLSGEKGKKGFAVFDTETSELEIVRIG